MSGWDQLAAGIRNETQGQQGDALAAAALQQLMQGNAQVPGATPMPGGQQPPQGMPGPTSPGGGMPPQQGSPPQPQGGMPPSPQGQPQGQNPIQMLMQKLGGLVQNRPQQGGGQPPQMQQQGAPQQPQQQGGMPGAQPMPGGSPQGGQPPQGGGQQQQGGPLTLQAVLGSVIKAAGPNPNPHQVMAAVSKLLPLMNAQSQEQTRQMMLQMRQGQLDQGQQRIDQGSQRLDQGQQRVDQGAQRLQEQKTKEQTREKEFDTKEQRYNAQNIVRNDQQVKKLQLQADSLKQRIIDNKDKSALGQWRAAAMAAHQYAMERILSVSAGMSPEDRKALQKEANDKFQSDLNEVRDAVGSTTPTGGTAPEGTKKVEGRMQADEPIVSKKVKTESFKKPPEVGTVMDGHKFKGGDPADQKNWESVGGT